MTAEPHSDHTAGHPNSAAPPAKPRRWNYSHTTAWALLAALVGAVLIFGHGQTTTSSTPTEPTVSGGYSISALLAAGYTQRDINYLIELDRLGYPYNGPAAAVEFGKAVGALRAQGAQPSTIKAYARKTNQGPYTDKQMDDITRTALTYYG